MSGTRHPIISNPTRQRTGKGITERDRHDLVFGAVEEQDREVKTGGVLERVEARPIGVDAQADSPLEWARGECGKALLFCIERENLRPGERGSIQDEAGDIAREG